MNIHRQARTTPKIREEIHASKGQMTIVQAVNHFNVSRGTIIKWRKRESFVDHSHRPHPLHTALSTIYFVGVREFIDETLTRQSHQPTQPKAKTFKDYELG